MNNKFMTQINKRVTAMILALMMVISMLPVSSLNVSADEVDTVKTDITFVEGNYTIEKNGIYQLPESLNSKITIAEGVKEVTIIGNGVEWDTNSENYGAITSPANENLLIDCKSAEGITLTLKDVYISNSGISENTIDFEGTGNTLVFDGTVVIDHDNGANGYAGIHVNKETELTIYGTTDSHCYMYKSEQAAGIGADNGEACGTINFGIENGANDFYFYMKGSKQGAVIGNGVNCPSTPGDITFYSGIYNLMANARGALIGGSAGPSSYDAGNVYIKGGLLNLNVDFSGAAIGGGGYATGNDKDGGNVYLAAGSVRTYIDTNAVGSWSSYNVTEAGVNDVAITANKVNENKEAVYILPVDTTGINADTYTVELDGQVYYVGPRYAYCFAYENTDRDVDNNVHPNGTPGNWIPLTSEANFYLYATEGDHTVTVNGVSWDCTWNEETNAFDVHNHEFMAGQCECGLIHSDYKWYYDHEDDTAYLIDTAAEFAAFAELVNSGITFVGETVELGADIDLEGYDWSAIGGEAKNVELEINSQEELQDAIDTYGIIYDKNNVSYAKGSDNNKSYDVACSYYYVNGKIFSGTFDGQNYTISNLYVNATTGYAGLFGNVDGTIKNFILSGEVTSTAAEKDFVAGVAGKLSEGGKISNIISDVTVTAKSCYNVGGIAGFVGTKTAMTSADNTFVIGCVNNGEVVGLSQVGGITGENAGTILSCANNGKIDALKTGSKVGCAGIAGRNGSIGYGIPESKGTIIGCYNTGDISANKWVGGIAGFGSATTVIRNCYNTGKVTGNGQTNALVGQCEAEGNTYEGAGVYNCYYLDTTKGYDESGVYGGTQENCGPKTEDEMKTDEFVALLGTAFTKDTENENNGYPILARTISATETMKTNAIAELDACMKEESLYREKEAAVVKVAYDNAKNAIEAAETLEDINVALVAAKAVINETKTDAQLTEEETAVIEAFAAIIALEDPTAEDKKQVDAARAAYDALDYPENVTNYDEFVLVENLVNALVSGNQAAIAKAYAAIAKAEAAKSKEEAENAKAEADKSKAEAENAKVEADKAKAEAEAAKAEAEAAKKEAEEAKAAAEANKANEELLAKAEAAIKAAEEAKAVAEAYAKAAAMTKTSVADLTVEAVSTKEIKATWKSVDGADAYTVVVKRNNKVVATETVTDTTYTYTAGKAGYAYTVEVAPSLTYNDKVYEGEEVAATAITKPSRPGITVKKTSKKVTVKSKKQACTGYQIQISKSKKFKTVYKKYTVKKTSLTKAIKLSALKSGKSYIRIRAYKTYNGKTVYSKWSKVKTVKR